MFKLRQNMLRTGTKAFELVHGTGLKPWLKKISPLPVQNHLKKKHLKKLLEFPTIFHIELTNYCNGRCWFCPTHKTTRQKGHMEFSLFRKIIDEIKPFSKRIKSIALYMDGEPTLHPRLIDCLRYASRTGIKRMYISSNMEYFDAELTDKIFTAGLGETLHHVICSLDSASENGYKQNRIGVDFKKAVRNTLYLFNQRNNKKSLYPLIFARMLVSELTADQVENFKRFWRDKADKVLCAKMHNWGGAIENKTLRLFKKDLEFTSCYFPFSQCAIQFDGAIRLCCVDYNGSVIMGNIRDEKIQNIWRGDKIDQIRRGHIKQDFDNIPNICSGCSYPQKGIWVAPFYW